MFWHMLLSLLVTVECISAQQQSSTLHIIKDASGTCYLTDLDEMVHHGYVVPQSQVVETLQNGQLIGKPNEKESEDSEVSILLQNWKIGSLVSEEDIEKLSPEIKAVCRDSSIHWLHTLIYSVQSSQGEMEGQHLNEKDEGTSRQRRWTPSCSRSDIKYRCKRQITYLNYAYYETCDRDRMFHHRMRAKCQDRGIWDQIMCCRECCDDRATADSFHPYCSNLILHSCYK